MSHASNDTEPNTPFLDLSFAGAERLLADLGQPRYRAQQIWEWVYRHAVDDYAAMTSLPQPLREQLAARALLSLLDPVAEEVSDDGRTVKVLFRLRRSPRRGAGIERANTIEAVLMLYDPRGDEAGPSRARRTVCISTQAGCPIGCPFCATGLAGFERNLTPGEIVEQVLYFERLGRRGQVAAGDCQPDERFITNVVFMGMGEPFANFDAMRQAVEALHSPVGYGLGARQITISTSGLVPGIRRLAADPLQVGLAVSLHAPTDELRNRLVPINRRYPIAELMAACRDYVARAGRRITFEYVLIDRVNDWVDQARVLARLIGGMLCHVNLIPLNPTGVPELRRSPRDRVLAFQAELQRHGVATTVRVEKGVEIEAACGQLRLRAAGTEPPLEAAGQGDRAGEIAPGRTGVSPGRVAPPPLSAPPP